MKCMCVNHSTSVHVLGFSRETLLAVITNIERRRLQDAPSEHPRASDNVECFFSMLRDSIGATKEEKCAEPFYI